MTTTTVVKTKQSSWLDALLGAIDLPVIVLGTLAFGAVLAGLWRLATGLGGSTALNDSIPWGIWIGFDFSLIAFSGAGFTMAGLVYVLRREEYRPALRPAILTGLLGYTAVLALLILDLGRPDRFYHFLIYWNVHSPLFEISWCVLLYTTVLLVEVSPQIFERLNMQKPVHMVHRIIVPVAIIAVTLSSLHQSTLGTLYLNMSYRLHFLWFTPILPLLFFVSAVMTGLCMAAAGYLLAMRATRQKEQTHVSLGLARFAGWVGIVYLVLKLGEILLAGEFPALLAFDAMSRRMWLELALVIVPVVIFLVPVLRKNREVLWLGLVLLLTGTLLNRFDATLFAQVTPQGATYTPALVEWLTTIGVVAAAMLAWLLSVRLLATFEKPATGEHR
jgi:Ni/Fe-hydrogenase subunit HybB-like protein